MENLVEHRHSIDRLSERSAPLKFNQKCLEGQFKMELERSSVLKFLLKRVLSIR